MSLQLGRCEKCERPWLVAQMSVVDGQALCWPCFGVWLEAEQERAKVRAEMAKIDEEIAKKAWKGNVRRLPKRTGSRMHA